MDVKPAPHPFFAFLVRVLSRQRCARCDEPLGPEARYHFKRKQYHQHCFDPVKKEPVP